MPTYRTTVHTDSETALVFSALADFSRAREWDPGVTAAHRVATPGPRAATEAPAIGDRFALTAKFARRETELVYETVELEPGRRIAFEASNAMVRSHDVITVTPGTRGSIVTYEARLDAKGFAVLATPLFALAFRRIGDAARDGLTEWLDRPAVLASPPRRQDV